MEEFRIVVGCRTMLRVRRRRAHAERRPILLLLVLLLMLLQTARVYGLYVDINVLVVGRRADAGPSVSAQLRVLHTVLRVLMVAVGQSAQRRHYRGQFGVHVAVAVVESVVGAGVRVGVADPVAVYSLLVQCRTGVGGMAQSRPRIAVGATIYRHCRETSFSLLGAFPSRGVQP